MAVLFTAPLRLTQPLGLLWGDKSPFVANGATVSRRPLTSEWRSLSQLSHFLRGSARRARGMNRYSIKGRHAGLHLQHNEITSA